MVATLIGLIIVIAGGTAALMLVYYLGDKLLDAIHNKQKKR